MPQGATKAYAAPEVLYSLPLQFDPQVWRDQVQEYLWINGASADWWSLGIVMFELLTRELPFKAAEESKADTDTSDVSSHYKHPWEDYCFFAAQQTWVRATNQLCVTLLILLMRVLVLLLHNRHEHFVLHLACYAALQ